MRPRTRRSVRKPELEVAELRDDLKIMAAERDHERGEVVKLKTYYLDLMVAEQINSDAVRGELT
eukprot:8497402-Alexandrium_andersonii.AAC.1